MVLKTDSESRFGSREIVEAQTCLSSRTKRAGQSFALVLNRNFISNSENLTTICRGEKERQKFIGFSQEKRKTEGFD